MAEYPDLHHKMSKKIAQLTKVIYHLNTKNDDHEAEMAALTAQHQAEMDEVMRDATSKLTKMKEMLQRQRDGGGGSEAVTRALTERHERDKATALAELEAIKAKYAAREKEMESSHAEKVSLLKLDLRKLQEQLSNRMEELKTSLAALDSFRAGAVKSDQLDALKKAHAEEMADVVREHNKKYSAMLAQQLNEQDTLKDQLEKVHKTLIENIKQEHKTAIARLTSQYEAERQARVEITADRDLLDGKYTALQRELAGLKDVEAKLGSSRSQMEERVQLLQRQLNDANADVESSNKMLRTLQESFSSFKSQSQSQQESLQNDIARLQLTVRQRDGKINELTSALEKATADLKTAASDLRREQDARLLAMNQGDATSTQLSQQLSSARADVQRLQEEVSSWEQRYFKLQQTLQDANAAAASQNEQAQKHIAELTSQLESLRSQLATATAEGDRLRHQLSETHSKWNDVESSQSGRIRELQQQCDTALADLAAVRSELEKSRADVETHKRESEATLKQQAAKHEDALNSALAEAGRQLTDATTALQQKHADVMKNTRTEHDKEVSQLRAKLDSALADAERYSKELKEISSSTGADLQASRAEISRLNTKVSGLERELASAKDDAVQSANLVEALKKQVEELRKEMKDVMREAAAKLERELASLELSDARKLSNALDAQQTKLTSEKDMALSQLKQYYEGMLTSSSESSSQALRATESKLADALQDIQHKSMQLRDMESDYEKRLRDAISAGEAALTAAEHAHASRQQAASDTARAELERLRKEMDAERLRALEVQQGKHDASIASLKGEHAQAMKSAQEEHGKAIVQLKKEADADKTQALKQQLDKLTSDHTTVLQSERRQHGEIVSQWETKTEELREKLKGAIGRGDGLAEQLTRTKETLAATIDKAAVDMHTTLMQHQARVADLESEHKSSVDSLLEEHMREMTAFQSEFQSAKQLFDEEKALLDARIVELELKYKNRESRPEDVARIKKLAELCQEKDATIKKLGEDMKFFKLELLNREENYNKMFNRQPTVGVMQVVKGKPSGSTPAGAPTPTALSGTGSGGGNKSARKDGVPSSAGNSTTTSMTGGDAGGLPPLGGGVPGNTTRAGSGGMRK